MSPTAARPFRQRRCGRRSSVLVADHPEQSRVARELWETTRIWIAKTVLLQTEWVLRAVMKVTPIDIRRAFELVLADPRASVEDRAVVQQAVAWLGAGVDFADALHLAWSAVAERFVTFDKAFIEAAAGVALRVERLGN
ncbi:MAG: type II toxin-antitoxin system VapC family toxin [Myxococcales bacterium]|nr:type II toxin-antitoxin system VapC family toxin [Myxococcales bacterium]